MTSPRLATEIEVDPRTASVPVGADHSAIVNAEDYVRVQGYRWRPRVDYTGKVYAQTTVKGQSVYMHRLLLGPGVGLDVDHINDNGLDNRRSNLRVATRSQNKANTSKPKFRNGKPCTSVFKGVSWDRSRQQWQAKIGVAGRHRNLGRYNSEAEAARAYDAAALAAWGEFARLNFPAEVQS